MTSKYACKPVHKIAPSDKDAREVELPDGCFSDPRKLGAALRGAGLMLPGQRVQSFRTEGDKVVVFPSGGSWHSIVIRPA